MKKKVPYFLFFLCLMGFMFFLSCGEGGFEPGTIFNAFETSVKGRFDESVSGKTKPLNPPMVNDENNFGFLWITDPHIRSDRRDYFGKLGMFADRNNVGFIVCSGDLSDNGTRENFNYVNYLTSVNLTVPFYSALGNHDLYGDGWEAFKELIGPSVVSFSPYSAYGLSNSLFIFIDTAECVVGEKQMDWIEFQLKNSSAGHRFILSHFCLYDGEFETPTILCDPDERYRLLSLLKKYQVDFFLCGHKHSAEKYNIYGTYHIQGGTASAYKSPLNDDAQFYYFQVQRDSVSFEKIYFKKLDY